MFDHHMPAATRLRASTIQLPIIDDQPLRPPLKWAGGKRWLVPHLQPFWEPFASKSRLVEPFVGGMAVTLGLRPRRALLNDVNPHVIAFYSCLKRGLQFDLKTVAVANDRETFLRNRRRFNELVTSGDSNSEEASLLFYYLNRTGFNGLCRFNSHGRFNVPFGRYKAIVYRKDFLDYADALQPYEFVHGDFQQLRLTRKDFIYADPPYDVQFTTYAAGGFSWDDQMRLAGWLAAHTGPVIASNQATPRVLQLYRSLGFTVRTIAAPRRISCDGNREDATEMFAHRNLR